MVSSDTVVGIVGAVILTGAMIAVFYYENNTADDGASIIGEGDNVYTFQYQQQNETPVKSQTITVTGVGSTEEVTFDLPAYVTNVLATITWSETGDTAPAPLASGMDKATVQLLNEGGTELDLQEGRSGKLEVQHGHHDDDNATPPQMTVRVRGDSAEDAEANLQNDTASKELHGVGTWKVVVKLDDVGEGQTSGQTDTSNEFTITVTYSYWAPVLQE